MLDECELKHLFGLINTQRGWFAEVAVQTVLPPLLFVVKPSDSVGKFGLGNPADLAREPIELDADVVRSSPPERTPSRMYGRTPNVHDRARRCTETPGIRR